MAKRTTPNQQELNKQLIPLYKEMADLTLPKCRECRLPYSCCDKLACEMTKQFAKQYWNVELKETDNTIVPFLGSSGCIVEPHLRPFCTFHTCAINNLGSDPDKEWTIKYFKLRQKINDLEYLRTTKP